MNRHRSVSVESPNKKLWRGQYDEKGYLPSMRNLEPYSSVSYLCGQRC